MKEELDLNNIIIKDSFPKDNKPKIFIANHNCIRDAFYLPKAINEKVVIITSSNSVYKKAPKESFMKKHLYMIPVEIYGDRKYSEVLIEECINLLQNNINLLIFPEGVYSIDYNINRGHTIVARIIEKAMNKNISMHLIPISIRIKGKEKDKASINFLEEECFIHFLKEINYQKYFQKKEKEISRKEKNEIYHNLIDQLMKKIAHDLEVQYIMKYKPYVNKKEIITFDSNQINIDILKQKDYFEKYKIDLKRRVKRIIEEK